MKGLKGAGKSTLMSKLCCSGAQYLRTPKPLQVVLTEYLGGDEGYHEEISRSLVHTAEWYWMKKAEKQLVDIPEVQASEKFIDKVSVLKTGIPLTIIDTRGFGYMETDLVMLNARLRKNVS
jgi:hypothetical protein